MSASNANQFNIQVLRAIAFLFESFPKLVNIDDKVLSPPKSHNVGFVTLMPSDGSEHGTMTWLIRNGIVSGNLEESSPLGTSVQTGAILAAQLPVKTLAILRKIESNVGKSLGDAAVDAVKQGNERDISVVAELLVRRLTGA